jgi:hypothetical protein
MLLLFEKHKPVIFAKYSKKYFKFIDYYYNRQRFEM